MLEHRFSDYRLARISSYCLDLLLLFAGCISVFLMINMPTRLGTPWIIIAILYSLMLLVYHGYLGLRTWAISRYDARYESFTYELQKFATWLLWVVLVMYLQLFILPVYLSGMSCSDSSCFTLRPVLIYKFWFTLTPMGLVPVTVMAFHVLMFVVWMLCNALLFRLFLKPQTLVERPRYLWMLLLAAINASLYFTLPIVSDLMMWLGD